MLATNSRHNSPCLGVVDTDWHFGAKNANTLLIRVDIIMGIEIDELETVVRSPALKSWYYRFFGLPHFGSRVRFSKIKNLLSLSSKTKILDIGCGIGSYLNYACHLSGCSGVGVDRLEDVITVARRVNNYYKLQNQFVVSDIDNYLSGLTKQRFDLILCIEVIEHLENPQAVLAKCISILTPQGKLILSVPTAPVHQWLFKIERDRFSYGVDRHVVDGYTEGTLTNFVKNANARIVKRVETFKVFGQVLWEISEKLRGIKVLYYFIVPVFGLLSRLDDLLSPSGTNNGMILVVEKDA